MKIWTEEETDMSKRCFGFRRCYIFHSKLSMVNLNLCKKFSIHGQAFILTLEPIIFGLIHTCFHAHPLQTFLLFGFISRSAQR